MEELQQTQEQQEQPIKETEEQKPEEQRIEEKKPTIEELEGNAIKLLRKKYEQTLKEKKELEEKIASLQEVAKIANVDEILNKLDKLEFENILYKKFPELKDEAENIMKERKEGESWEEAIYRYIGKKKATAKEEKAGFSLGSAQTPRIVSEPDFLKLPKEEQEKIARELFKQVFGRE
jgi:vacuolar-type H+-ATPase subunit I/STV1